MEQKINTYEDACGVFEKVTAPLKGMYAKKYTEERKGFYRCKLYAIDEKKVDTYFCRNDIPGVPGGCSSETVQLEIPGYRCVDSLVFKIDKGATIAW